MKCKLLLLLGWLAACTPDQPVQRPWQAASTLEFILKRNFLMCRANVECADSVPSYASVLHCTLDPMGTASYLFYFESRSELSYDREAGEACLGVLARATSPCHYPAYFSRFRAMGQPCSRVFAGQVPTGEVAWDEMTCVSGSTTTPVGGCPGTCIEPRAIGGPCTRAECGEGASCEDGVCVDQQPGGEGQGCIWRRCAPGLVCTSDETHSSSCRSPVQIGHVCDWTHPCATGLDCVNDSGVGTTCRVQRRLGQVCSQTRTCIAGLTCASNQRCRGIHSWGSACHNDLDCDAQDLRCIGAHGLTQGSCRFKPQVGDACKPDASDTSPDRCVPGLFCDPATQRCQAWTGVGQVCSHWGECPPPLECHGGRCRGLGATGEPCEGYWDCQSGRACTSGTCQPLRGAGQSCEPHGCVAGLHCVEAVCIPAGQFGAPCDGGEDCATGLDCNGGLCAGSVCAP